MRGELRCEAVARPFARRSALAAECGLQRGVFVHETDPRGRQSHGGQFWLYYRGNYRSRRTEKPGFRLPGDDVFMRRIRFFRQAVVTGFRWAKGVLDNVGLAITAAALAIGVTVGGFLLHRPAWFLGIFAVVLFVSVLGEGAYRTWEDAERRARAAQPPSGLSSAGDADALWLSEQLRAGNELLDRWRMGTPSYNAQDEIQDAAVWERRTQDGLAARLPAYGGLFGLDVGFGQEFIFSPVEVRERTRLRRRLHRLGEITDRHSREQVK